MYDHSAFSINMKFLADNNSNNDDDNNNDCNQVRQLAWIDVLSAEVRPVHYDKVQKRWMAYSPMVCIFSLKVCPGTLRMICTGIPTNEGFAPTTTTTILDTNTSRTLFDQLIQTSSKLPVKFHKANANFFHWRFNSDIFGLHFIDPLACAKTYEHFVEATSYAMIQQSTVSVSSHQYQVISDVPSLGNTMNGQNELLALQDHIPHHHHQPSSARPTTDMNNNVLQGQPLPPPPPPPLPSSASLPSRNLSAPDMLATTKKKKNKTPKRESLALADGKHPSADFMNEIQQKIERFRQKAEEASNENSESCSKTSMAASADSGGSAHTGPSAHTSSRRPSGASSAASLCAASMPNTDEGCLQQTSGSCRCCSIATDSGHQINPSATSTSPGPSGLSAVMLAGDTACRKLKQDIVEDVVARMRIEIEKCKTEIVEEIKKMLLNK